MYAVHEHWQLQELMVLRVWAQSTLSSVCVGFAAALMFINMKAV